MGNFQIQLFGRPTLISETGASRLTDRLALFLAMLCSAPNLSLDRAELAEHLWPDRITGRINLRKFLSRLQQAGPPICDLVDAKSDLVSLNKCASSCDLMQFLDALKSREQSAAVNALSLVQGQFLEGIKNLPPIAEDWLRVQREIVSEQALELKDIILSDSRRFGKLETRHQSIIAKSLRALNVGGYRSVSKVVAAPERSVDEPNDISRKRDSRPRLAFYEPETSEVQPTGFPISRFVIEIADRLSSYRTFVVLACHSSFQIGRDDSSRSLKDELRPDYSAHTALALGSQGPVLRLEMVRESDSSIFWAAEFKLNTQDIVLTGSAIVRNVVATLAEALEKDVTERAKSEADSSAFLQYLCGREAQSGSDLPSVRRARKLFSQALCTDPSFSVARARLAETYLAEWLLRGGQDGEVLQRARKEANKALCDDRGSSIAHWISGATALYQRDYDLVLGAFETAETLCPNSADLLLDYADALSHLEEESKAEATFTRALDLNPAPPDRYWWFGASIALSCGEFDIAAQRCDSIVSPEVGIGMRTTSYALSGNLELARDWAKQLQEVLPGQSIDDLAGLMPGSDKSSLHRNYKEGLRIAGLD